LVPSALKIWARMAVADVSPPAVMPVMKSGLIDRLLGNRYQFERTSCTLCDVLANSPGAAGNR
jgi:hypothetical protein